MRRGRMFVRRRALMQPSGQNLGAKRLADVVDQRFGFASACNHQSSGNSARSSRRVGATGHIRLVRRLDCLQHRAFRSADDDRRMAGQLPSLGIGGRLVDLGRQVHKLYNHPRAIRSLPGRFSTCETNAQDSQLKAYPGVVTGSVDVIGNDYFDSVGVALRYNLCCNSCAAILRRCLRESVRRNR